MFDVSELYISLEVPDESWGQGDWVEVRFDGLLDLAWGMRDDVLKYSFVNGFSDETWGGSTIRLDSSGGGTTDGSGFGRTMGSGRNFFELSHPLNSGDSNDFSVGPDGRVGICIRYSRDGNGSSRSVYPSSCVLTVYSQTRYAELTL